MKNALNIINDYAAYLVIGLALITVLLIIFVFILLRAVNKLEKRYRRLMRGTEAKSLEESVISYLDRVDAVDNKVNELSNKCDHIESEMKNCIQKVAITRYKAFDDVGSDLSFSIALLDEENDGVILTGLYSRNDSTTYAKPVDKGISRYDLSDEEIQVLNDAMERK